MIDFLKRMRVFAAEGLEVGYFIHTQDHLKFFLAHHTLPIRLTILACFHTGKTKFAFELSDVNGSLYKGVAITEGEMMLVSGDICNKIQSIVHAGDGNEG